MHRSRLAGFIIDCQNADLPEAASFWSAALGMPTGAHQGNYVTLDARSRDLSIEVQSVDHPSRLHLDIESDDVEAEAQRLEKLGAKRVGAVQTWIVLEAPTGQRFCVIRAKQNLDGAPGAQLWP
jgi:catechol 2,3-dioxygenase-like lactoylglutathione lyase family enzyme